MVATPVLDAGAVRRVSSNLTLGTITIKSGMAEWFNAAVLKTADHSWSVGSNPSPTAPS